MDYALSEQQEMLKNTARDFLEKECTKELVRQTEEDDKGYSPELWKKMADLGWMGLVYPEEYGGSGLDFVDLTVLLEEIGRALVPGPFVSTVVSCGMGMLRHGTAAQKQEVLPGIVKGETKMALALMEAGATYDPVDITLRASAENDTFVLDGTKLFVKDGHLADRFLVVARTRPGGERGEGITVFLVDAGSKGIACNQLKTFTADRQCEVIFNSVHVPRANVLGKVDEGWEVVRDILQLSALAVSALMVGGAQQVLEMATNYAKERVQFGKPIGGFQAIQHKCANIQVDVAGARDIAYQTAWKLSEGMPCNKDISITKAWISEGYRKACVEGTQIHGGIGITRDCDMQLYYRRAKAMEMAFGDADYHLELVACEMGL